MATTEVKSYRVTIERTPIPSLNPEVAAAPFTTTHTIFQVPAGKTWLVIKMWVRWVRSTAGKGMSLRIEKTRSDGGESMLLKWDEPGDSQWLPDDKELEAGALEVAKDLVFEDQEMIRQVLTAKRSAIVVMQYEMSCHEITP